MPRSRHKKEDLPFEEVIGDDWSHDLDIAEVPIGNKPMLVLGAVVFAIAVAIFGRVMFLNFSQTYYSARAEGNMAQSA